MAAKDPKIMGLWAVVAMGIGSMIGAGIFALLGIIGAKAGAATYVSFIVAGIVTMLTGYNYAVMGARFPTSGGVADYLMEGFGNGVISGAATLMFYIALIVSTAMVAKAFGYYATRLVIGESPSDAWSHGFATGIVVVLAVINMLGAAAAGRIELLIVGLKLTILGIFTAVTLLLVKPQFLSPAHFGSTPEIVSTLGLSLLAYAGFGVMANAGGHVTNPAKTMPRAFYLAIGIVMLVYVSLSVAVFGTLPLASVIAYRDTALAEAAKPVFGQAGFVAMSLAAMLSTASATNSNLFSSLNLQRFQAKKGQLPAAFNRPVWNRGTVGYVGSLVLVLVMINFMHLVEIANVATASFLVCYIAVNCASFAVARKTGASRFIVVLSVLSITIFLVVFMVQMIQTQPATVVLFGVFVAACTLVELFQKWQRTTESAKG